MSDQPQRPTSDDADAWAAYRKDWQTYAAEWHNANPDVPHSDDAVPGWLEYHAAWQPHWMALGTTWRIEPEIDAERQAYLAERRLVKPDIEHGIYPFHDGNGSIKLTRADIEWLLATHQSKAVTGPVQWIVEKDKTESERRTGLDLRGADLRDVDLGGLPLACMLGALTRRQARDATRKQRRMAAVHLERANLVASHLEAAELGRAYLEGADLSQVHLEQANCFAAHLEASNFTDACLAGADFVRAFFDTAVYLHRTSLTSREDGGVHMVDIRWGEANLATAKWAELKMLGDEQRARRGGRLADFERAVRANRQVALALRSQGLNEHADRFAYRAQMLQRQVLRRMGVRKWPAYIGSLILDFISGYGYRPVRSFLVYLAAIIWFANAYHWLGSLPPLDATVFSMASFHGRGFFPSESFTLHSPVAIVAGVEAFFGLLIEITFIATFTQRFFAR